MSLIQNGDIRACDKGQRMLLSSTLHLKGSLSVLRGIIPLNKNKRVQRVPNHTYKRELNL